MIRLGTICADSMGYFPRSHPPSLKSIRRLLQRKKYQHLRLKWSWCLGRSRETRHRRFEWSNRRSNHRSSPLRSALRRGPCIGLPECSSGLPDHVHELGSVLVPCDAPIRPYWHCCWGLQRSYCRPAETDALSFRLSRSEAGTADIWDKYRRDLTRSWSKLSSRWWAEGWCSRRRTY